jgi:hypothetical protein
LCTKDEVPCLPLGRIALIGVDNSDPWAYYAMVTLRQPDGSEVSFDGLTSYEYMGVIKDAQGNLKIANLHPGMIYPLKQQ